MSTSGIKDEARQLIEQLPDDSTWDDLLYAFSVRQAIEAGIVASKASRARSIDEVKRKFGLTG